MEKKTTESYSGDEANAKIAELEKHKSGTTKTVTVGADGNQKIKIEKKVIIKEEK